MSDLTIDEVFMWKENTGLLGKQNFGRGGAHVNSRTYEEIKRRCDVVEVADWMSAFCSFSRHLNSFSIHVQEDVPDGILRPCDCSLLDPPTEAIK